MLPRPPRWVWLVVPVVVLVYLFGLTSAGLLGPDEPRYASVAREMATSGDWITPRLWGQPWFEKPALLYWMIAAGFRSGLGEELAPRLPVALMALAFLSFYWWILRREFGLRTAWYAALMLATAAGWVGFSQVGVTDLPMTAAFSAAMLLALPWVAKGDARYLPLTAALLGVAVLAKGLVPLVLALPLAAVVALKRGPRALGALLQWRVAVPFLIVALPWYVLCTIRNGREFLRVFFWQHQFERLHSPALQHIQPFWFYVPILFVGLLPWAPLAALGFRPQHWREPRRAFLLAWVLFGFVFFSLAVNKLPGYMLPLLPAICAVMGVGMAEASNTGVSLGLAASALLLAIFPVGSRLLPAALAQGLSRAPAAHLGWSWAAAVAAAILVVLLARRDRTFEAFTFLALCAAASLLYVKAAALPEIDRVASARSLWRQIAAKREETCVATLNRNFRYGLNYYSGVPLPDCTEQPEPLEIRQQPGEAPQIDRSSAMLAQPAPSR